MDNVVNILVVDTSASCCTTLSSLLIEKGHRVHCASSAEEALASSGRSASTWF